MAAYVKNACLTYSANGFHVNFGLISTTQLKVQEKHWGYRYLAKSFQDEYKFTSTADLGVSVAYKFCDSFSADLAVFNGEGYRKLESDNSFKTGLGLTFNPVDGLTCRGFYDFMSNNGVSQNSLIAFIGYASGKLSLGAEYNRQNNRAYIAGKDWYGTSFTLPIKLLNW